MRNSKFHFCILLALSLGCQSSTTVDSDARVTTIEGSGMQLISLNLPGMT